MSQKESSPKSLKNFTGFVAYYKDDRKIREKENFFSTLLNKKCATNWAEINKENLIALELVWQGTPRIKVSVEEYPQIVPESWLFFQSGYYDIATKDLKVLNRNIGFIDNGLQNVFSIDEETGVLRIFTRADKSK